jgi:hypothetical protein
MLIKLSSFNGRARDTEVPRPPHLRRDVSAKFED